MAIIFNAKKLKVISALHKPEKRGEFFVCVETNRGDLVIVELKKYLHRFGKFRKAEETT